MRFAQGGPEHTGLLSLSPRDIFIGKGPHKALYRLHRVRPLALRRIRPCTRNKAPALRRSRHVLTEPGLHAMVVEQGGETRHIAGARA